VARPRPRRQRAIERTKAFDRDLKRLAKQGKDLDLLGHKEQRPLGHVVAAIVGTDVPGGTRAAIPQRDVSGVANVS
jgi:hypothetical protein